MLTESKKPSFLFINKLDKEHSSFEKMIEAVQKEFGKNCVPITYPIGKETTFKEVVDLLNKAAVESISGDDKDKALKYREQLIEAIAETDDALIEKYLGGEELSEGEIINGLKKAVNAGNAHPVFCGSATKGIGVEELINAIIKFVPSPIDVTPIQATSPDGTNPIEYKVSADEPFAAQVFKTVIDPYVGQLTIFRVFSGSLQSNTGFYNVNKSAKEKIGQIFLLKGKEQKVVDKVQAGDIAAVAKLKETSAGDTLCNESRRLKFDTIKMPEPAISLSLKPKTRQDEERIMTALSKLGSEDPTFKYGRDQQTKRIDSIGDWGI
ncbi:unnamed protein product, partial [marine sediment metagenome]